MMLYKLTPDEFTARKHVLVLSDKGLRFREEIKSQEQLDLEDFHLPPINSAALHQDSRVQVLRGEQPINVLVDELKKDLNIKRPYMDKAINKFAEKITNEKPSNQITSKLQKLYQELEKHTRLLEKRKVKFHKNSTHQAKEQKEQTSLLEVSEIQDKLASVNALEAKLQRMQQNYQNEIKIRDDTLQKVKMNANLHRLQREAEVEQVPEPVIIDQALRQSQYQDRRQIRLKDYQKYKFEKVWNKQPPPNYTSKQALIEQEKKRQQQLLKEQLEYELELQRRNGNDIEQ